MDRLLQFVLSNAVAAMALAVLAAGAARVIKRPAVTRALWIVVLLKLLTPPVWTIPVTRPQAQAAAVARVAEVTEPEEYTIADEPYDPDEEANIEVNIDAPAPSSQPAAVSYPTPGEDFPWVTAVVIVWLAGVLVVGGLILRSSLRLRRIVRQSVVAPMGVRRRAIHLSLVMDVGRCPEVLLARGAVPPMLCATGMRSRIILPASLWSRLDEAQQDTVLVHELAHLRHGDHWVRRLELIAAVIYWWHPAVWWSRAQLRESSEQCCDAWVVWALPRLARSYAEALVETVDFISLSRPGLPVLASGMGQFTDLKRRLVMINQAKAGRALSRGGYTAVCSLAGLLLPLAPSFAQEAAPVAPVPPNPPVEVRPPTPADIAPDAPKPEPAPKANFFLDQKSFKYSEDGADPGTKSKTDQGRAEVERARAQVEKLRSQLRDAERRLNDLQRNVSRSEAEMERNKAQAEAQKERAKAMAEAQKERAKAQEERARAQAEAQKARAMAAADRARAGQERRSRDGQTDEFASPRPKIDTNFQYRAEPPRAQPPRTDEYVKAGARLKAAGGGEQGGNDALERRLDRLEKQLDEMVNQLQQMRRQAGRPTPPARPTPARRGQDQGQGQNQDQ
jgi:beta-lactamase regulating signal transducer with metallopeptidase domain